MESRRRLLLGVAGALSATGLAACTVGPDFQRPVLPRQAAFTPEKTPAQPASAESPGGDAQRFIEGGDVPGQWWTLFHSAQLDALIDEALKANPDLAAAQAALRQGREQGYADEGALFPTLSASGSATREKISGAAFGIPSLPGAAGSAGSPYSPTLTVMSASLNVSYAPDVFGGVRRQVESARAQAEYQRFELEATYLTLTSNVVNSAVTLASLRDQAAATNDIIRIESDQLKLVQQKYEFGSVSRSDVLTQEAALAQTRATLPPLQKQLAQARNQLMTYLGRYPSQDKGESFELASLTLPDRLPVSLPSSLVEQRPDVRSAEAQLHEASANIGVAIANQLPQFTITGQLGSSTSSLANLFSPGTGVWSIAGTLAQSIFDGGAAEHHRRAAVAAYDEAAAQYRKAVLSAFQDVANALRAVQTDAAALDADAVAERAARDSLEFVRQQYRMGAIDQVALLNAEQTYENAVLTRVRAQAARYTDTAALFQALGGGWWNRNDVPPADTHPVRFVLPPLREIKLPSKP